MGMLLLLLPYASEWTTAAIRDSTVSIEAKSFRNHCNVQATRNAKTGRVLLLPYRNISNRIKSPEGSRPQVVAAEVCAP
jgi:hypothetical protein